MQFAFYLSDTSRKGYPMAGEYEASYKFIQNYGVSQKITTTILMKEMIRTTRNKYFHKQYD